MTAELFTFEKEPTGYNKCSKWCSFAFTLQCDAWFFALYKYSYLLIYLLHTCL